MQAIIGQKKLQTQKFLEDGTRIPVTEIFVGDVPVIFIKTMDKNGYSAIQLGFGSKKHPTKAQVGHIRGAKIQKAPRFLKEIRVEGDETIQPGDTVKASDVLQPGDLVDVSGISKGKGFAGGVKRYHFKGGPRTHGQSDRERAPGSIGQTTTPGRVYKGKRMAGRMGFENVTVKNLKVVDLSDTSIYIAGLVPGHVDSLITIKKVGELGKKFVPVLQDEVQKEIKSQAQTHVPEEQSEKKEEGK